MRSPNSWLKTDALLTALAVMRRVGLCGFVASSFFAAALRAAESGAQGSDPEKQKESDWVDARWNQTDLGNFHASVLPLPGGAVAKGLSIRVGANREATVAYDTGSASFRAGWTNGFLSFSGTRYGLMHAPKPAGDIRLIFPDKAWGAASVKWRGLHVNGARVVLDYTVGYTRVKELPGYHAVDGLAVFTR